MEFWNKLRTWVAGHKLVAGFSVFIILFVLASFSLSVILSMQGVKQSSQGLKPGSFEAPGFAGEESVVDRAIAPDSFIEPSGGQEVEVKQAALTIESQDAEVESQNIRDLSGGYEGYVERSNKSETNTLLSISMTVRLPQEGFEGFIEELKAQFDVESFNVNNYRIPIQRELDELDIIRQALDDYTSIRRQILAMPASEQKINLLMSATNRQLELKQREGAFERQLSGKQRQGDLATVSVTLNQKLKADLLPEDIGNRFRDGFKQAFDSVVDSVVAVATNSIALLFLMIKWIVYIVIALVPILLIYKFGKPLYRRLGLGKDADTSQKDQKRK